MATMKKTVTKGRNPGPLKGPLKPVLTKGRPGDMKPGMTQNKPTVANTLSPSQLARMTPAQRAAYAKNQAYAKSKTPTLKKNLKGKK